MSYGKSEEISWILTLICEQEDSIRIPHILKEFEKENRDISFEIGETRSFAPLFDESSIDVVLKIAPLAVPFLTEIMKALLRRLQENRVRTAYKDRYRLATEMLSDKSPLLLEEATDSHHHSRYVFKTVYGRYVWEYDRGEVHMKKTEE